MARLKSTLGVCKVSTLRELVESPEMVSFREWFANSRAEDYLAEDMSVTAEGSKPSAR